MRGRRLSKRISNRASHINIIILRPTISTDIPSQDTSNQCDLTRRRCRRGHLRFPDVLLTLNLTLFIMKAINMNMGNMFMGNMFSILILNMNLIKSISGP